MAQSLIINDENSLLKFLVKDGNGIKGLVESGITEVPTRYIQPPEKRVTNQKAAPGSAETIAIDLSELDGPNHDQVVKAITHAAETLGFFQVVNHGVPVELLESLKAAAHKFFGQPAEKKSLYLNGVSPHPMVTYGTSYNPQKEKVLEWKDYISMIHTTDADALEFWPNDIKEEVLGYITTSRQLVKRLLKVLIGNLGVKLDDSKIDEIMGFKRVLVNYYPPCPNPDLTVGVGKHSDGDLLTVLLQDGIGGLHVKKRENEEWVEIPPIDGALVINVGDMLELYSNGWYKSAEHIVRTTSKESRVSAPIFNAPFPSVKMAPFPEVVARDGVARYREVTCDDYMNHHLGKSLDGKHTLDFAKI